MIDDDLSSESNESRDVFSASGPVRGKSDAEQYHETLRQRLDLAEERAQSFDVEDELADEHARRLLKDDIEEMYDGAVDVDEPPEAFDAFERRVTLRRLAHTAVQYGRYPRANGAIVMNVESDDVDEPLKLADAGEFIGDNSSPYHGQLAKNAIDRIVEYGECAEGTLAWISRTEYVHPDVAEYALDALEEVHATDDTDERGFWKTLSSLVRGGDG